MADLNWMTASDLASALTSGEVSAREALDAHVAHCEKVNPDLNVVVTTDIERAQQRADAIDAARASGVALGPLAGVPMTVKDSLMTAGVRTTSGAPELADFVPEIDAVPVRNVCLLYTSPSPRD